MWMLYAVYIFFLLLVVSFHMAAQHEDKKKHTLMTIIAFILSVGTFGVIAAAHFAVGSNDTATVQALVLPIAAVVYLALSALILRLPIGNRKSSLNDSKKCAIVCWIITMLIPIIFPVMKYTVCMSKSDSSASEYKDLTKHISYFKLIEMGTKDSDLANDITIISLMIIIIPALLIAANIFAPKKLQIWTNICGMAAHCITLAVFSNQTSSDTNIGKYIMLKSIDSSTIQKGIDSLSNGYTQSSETLSTSLGISLSVLSMIFLCAYLSVSTFYYTYSYKQNVSAESPIS